jgi:excisionase family DNA binding protein
MRYDPPQLLTVKEAAALLRQTPWSVRQKVGRGEIPAVRVGVGPKAPIRIDAGELERWLHSSDSQPAGAADGSPSPHDGLEGDAA